MSLDIGAEADMGIRISISKNTTMRLGARARFNLVTLNIETEQPADGRSSAVSSIELIPNMFLPENSREKMEAYGAPASITSFVVPTGYSFNLDGSTLYQSIAAIFIAQLYGIDLSIWQEIILVLTLMVTSKGIAGVPGVSFVVLLATLGSVGIPLEGLAFIAGVDRILDMARTALNVVGNALAVLVIAKWEHKFDRKKALAYEREVLGKFDKTADQ